MDDALQRLPHGPSFRFLDHMIALEGGRNGRASYRITGDEAFLEGHFPANPMMPGVILIEAIAQLAGVVAQSDPEHAALPDLRLSGVRAAKIFGAAVPGDELEIHVAIEGRMGNLIQAAGGVSGPNGPLAEAKVVLSGG